MTPTSRIGVVLSMMLLQPVFGCGEGQLVLTGSCGDEESSPPDSWTVIDADVCVSSDAELDPGLQPDQPDGGEVTNCDPSDPTAAVCQDGLYCNGREVCSPAGECRPGTPVSCNDGDPITRDWCDEEYDSCPHT